MACIRSKYYALDVSQGITLNVGHFYPSLYLISISVSCSATLCAATILVLSHLANTFGCIFVVFHTMARPSYDVFFCVTFFSNQV